MQILGPDLVSFCVHAPAIGVFFPQETKEKDNLAFAQFPCSSCRFPEITRKTKEEITLPFQGLLVTTLTISLKSLSDVLF